MAQLDALSFPVQPHQRCRVTSADSIRRRALARLYERRSAVDQLIRSLERYQRDQATLRTRCVDVTDGKTSS
jgi:hypothetical protein